MPLRYLGQGRDALGKSGVQGSVIEAEHLHQLRGPSPSSKVIPAHRETH